MIINATNRSLFALPRLAWKAATKKVRNENKVEKEGFGLLSSFERMMSLQVDTVIRSWDA